MSIQVDLVPIAQTSIAKSTPKKQLHSSLPPTTKWDSTKIILILSIDTAHIYISISSRIYSSSRIFIDVNIISPFSKLKPITISVPTKHTSVHQSTRTNNYINYYTRNNNAVHPKSSLYINNSYIKLKPKKSKCNTPYYYSL